MFDKWIRIGSCQVVNYEKFWQLDPVEKPKYVPVEGIVTLITFLKAYSDDDSDQTFWGFFILDRREALGQSIALNADVVRGFFKKYAPAKKFFMRHAKKLWRQTPTAIKDPHLAILFRKTTARKCATSTETQKRDSGFKLIPPPNSPPGEEKMPEITKEISKKGEPEER